jgi:hypothetical protein
VGLAVVHAPSRGVHHLYGEATLSQELHTARLPRPHVLVGYWWQHTRLYLGHLQHNSYSCDFVSQPPPNRTCRRVGHQRVALTGTFPMAPLQTARESFDLKQLSSGLLRASLASWPALLRRSASRVPHRAWASDHLCHFPLCTALPCALVGRDSHEYSWHSVTLGVASGRPSRVPSPRNVSSTT